MNMRLVWGLLFIVICFNTSAQFSIDDIDFSQVQYKKVKDYILNQKRNNVNTINQIHPSCTSKTDLSSYEKQEKTYLIKENFSKVWSSYINTSPAESWESKHISFGLLISKPTNSVIYPGGKFHAIDTGQVIFLNLSLLRGFYQLPMAFEIINVNHDDGIVEFSYIKGNKAQGIQRLHFIPTPEGYTRIIHSSFYKSKSKVRDKILYPFFHIKTTNEFHRNLKRILKHKQRS